MSILDTAIIQLRRYIDHRLALQEPFRSTVAGTDGDLVLITRPGASTADAEPAAKVTSDVLAAGDEVMVQPVLGKPVVIGKVRRIAAPGYTSITGEVVPVSFMERSFSTTSVDTLVHLRTKEGALVLPAPGTYRLFLTLFAQTRRTAQYGGSILQVRYGPTNGTIVEAQLWSSNYTSFEHTGDGDGTGGGAMMNTGHIELTTTTPNEAPVLTVWGGAGASSAAGTTWFSGVVVSGWYQRIG